MTVMVLHAADKYTDEQCKIWEQEAIEAGLPDYVAVATDTVIVDTIERRTYTEHAINIMSLFAYVKKYGKFQPEDIEEYKMKGQITFVAPMKVKSEI